MKIKWWDKKDKLNNICKEKLKTNKIALPLYISLLYKDSELMSKSPTIANNKLYSIH